MTIELSSRKQIRDLSRRDFWKPELPHASHSGALLGVFEKGKRLLRRFIGEEPHDPPFAPVSPRWSNFGRTASLRFQSSGSTVRLRRRDGPNLAPKRAALLQALGRSR